MSAAWNTVWNLSDVGPGCKAGAHLRPINASQPPASVRLLPGQCGAPATRMVHPEQRELGACRRPASETGLAAQVPELREKFQTIEYSFSLLSATPSPVLRVVIKGNCYTSSVATRSAAALKKALDASPGAGCQDAGRLVHYTGEHLAQATDADMRLDHLLPVLEKGRQPVRTRSLLDQGLFERCLAPASLHFPDRLRRARATRVPPEYLPELAAEERSQIRSRASLWRWWNATLASTSPLPPADPPAFLAPLFNLTYSITFTPVVAGPHLIYVRIDHAAANEALHPIPDDESSWRGPFVGERASGSPFRVEVRAHANGEVEGDQAGRRDRLRACVASDFRDLSAAALVAPDESALRLPVSRWRYQPRDCVLAPYRVRCTDVARCLSRVRLTLIGDSMMERLRYAFAETLLPAAGARAWGLCHESSKCDGLWYWASCWDFNPRFLAAKQTFTSAADLRISECAEAVGRRRKADALRRHVRRRKQDRAAEYALRALQPVEINDPSHAIPDAAHPERCSGRWASTVQGMFEALAAVDPPRARGKGVSMVDADAQCHGSALVLNLAGLHAAAWGNLTIDAWGAALHAALSLATSTFGTVVYMTTPTAHPIHYPRWERMPAEFHALNALRTRRVNELERRTLVHFPSVAVIDAHSLTGLLEDASHRCTDIRHHDFDANRQLMSLTLALLCGGER